MTKKYRTHGTGHLSKHGYIVIYRDGKRVFEHVAVAERVLGRPLPAGADVHHINECRSDNRPDNLVICQSREYHKLLHMRMNALNQSGDASFLKCRFCKQYDDKTSLRQQKVNRGFNPLWAHAECENSYARERRMQRTGGCS